MLLSCEKGGILAKRPEKGPGCQAIAIRSGIESQMMANGEQKIQQLLLPKNTPSRKDSRNRVEPLQIPPQSHVAPNLPTGVGQNTFQARYIPESVGVFLPAQKADP